MVKAKKAPTKRKSRKRGLRTAPPYVSPFQTLDGKMSFTPEATASMAEIVERVQKLKDMFFALPEVVSEIGKIIDLARQVFGSTFTQDSFEMLQGAELTPEILHVGMNQIRETFMEQGRNEIREKYALEELAGINKEWNVPVLPNFVSPDADSLDADFEEA